MVRVFHRPFSRVAGVLAVAALTSPAVAAVEFTPWESLGDIVKLAETEPTTVMLVITQPDWCPPCISLDDALRGDDDIADITDGWVVAEVRGYEAAHSRELRQQSIEFVGTPTTMVIELPAGSSRLRQGRLVGVINGHPDDYVDQLRAIGSTSIDLSAREAEVRASGSIHGWLELADAYVRRGQSARARMAYRNALSIPADAADAQGIGADSLDALHKSVRWQVIENVHRRLAGDLRTTRLALDHYAEDYPSETLTDHFVYMESWVETGMGRGTQANSAMKHHFVEDRDADGILRYLYFAFRSDNQDIWADAEEVARESIEAHPDDAAALHAAHGRLLRRLERGNDALAAFQRAVDLTTEDDPKRAVYAGQLEYLKRNPIRLQ